jgi:hypothetical protein
MVEIEEKTLVRMNQLEIELGQCLNMTNQREPTLASMN